MDSIKVRGARTHNLKNIDVDIPKNKIVVFTGLSGSGKSSLAFDTLFAEGQRRYIESLSTYARQFLEVLQKPDVDSIEGLSPAIAIEQKSKNNNPRSTVGTVTEIHDYLRLLYSRTGIQHCPEHQEPLKAYSISEMIEFILALGIDKRILILAPVANTRGQPTLNLIERFRAQGFFRIRIDGELVDLDDPTTPSMDDKKKGVELVIDRVRIAADSKGRLAESLETALKQSPEKILVHDIDAGQDFSLSAIFSCPKCEYTSTALDARMFSFNHPNGSCPTCGGLGEFKSFDVEKIVAHPTLSLASGAISGWNKRNKFFFDMLKSLSEHYHFDLHTPFEDLPSDVKQVVLYGSGKTKIKFYYQGRDNKTKTEQHNFEGIIENFSRRFEETKEDAVKEELAKFISLRQCSDCSGSRLRPEARNVKVAGLTIAEVNAMTLAEAKSFFESLVHHPQTKIVSERIITEIINRVGFLIDVGLGYLSLERQASTLSGGESQRIRLASQIGAGLSGVMYVLDEPSIGLHQRDNQRLIESIKKLRDLGNTVIVVEHDEETISQSDYVIDIGPGSGETGGKIVSQGTPGHLVSDPQSVTGPYLSGTKKIYEFPRKPITNVTPSITLTGARANNLKNLNLKIPLGAFVCVTGVSGSGKSTLINDTFVPAMAHQLGTKLKGEHLYDDITETDQIKFLVNIDQSPIGRTPRSNPATYTGMFNIIRELFAQVPLARERGYTSGRFSFNVKGGRCEACQGEGSRRIELHFLPDVFVECEICKGKRYNQETLDINYKGKSIHDVLQMNVKEALTFFSSVPSLRRKLSILDEVGLGYMSLGQSAVSLSGGEAQRVKLASELSKRNTGNTLYVLDEPTTGLHFNDISWLLQILIKLRDQGNSIVVIEHNLDVIRRADWIIDLGPEGGNQGGIIVAEGTPEQLAGIEHSHTGYFLKQILLT
ncbi:MAG: excinuclease ABC subunit UvrA [Burkholderiales bacterium]|nr:excinuclease ABC subunit UvrA [Burkholderiales bacterium]|tara:strand:+ start:33087 stop:35909 length:2823 start_codon:yes stop_codon:yes gene_type:complete